ncbi:PAXI-like protein [Mya arenaria]|uniref:PAXI-like protein n=1 Tax=Mya arenaria TaxID=6604 RepID=A0ABY7E1W0_MYAAR|nr:PAXI-like protein [Mya arenaria]
MLKPDIKILDGKFQKIQLTGVFFNPVHPCMCVGDKVPVLGIIEIFGQVCKGSDKSHLYVVYWKVDVAFKHESLRLLDHTDALLADLQSTTAHISYNNSGPPPARPATQVSPAPKLGNQPEPGGRVSETPPPLPPPPQDLPDAIPPPHQFDDQGRPSSHSSRGSGDGQYNWREPAGPPQSSYSPGPHQSSYSPGPHQSGYQQAQPGYQPGPPQPGYQPAPPQTSYQQAQPQPGYQSAPPQQGYQQAPPQPDMSAISNNLSELDQLLSDLNSAQFMAEVDKKSDQPAEINTCMCDSDMKQPPPVAPKPGRGGGGTSVDSLLDQLETSVPPAQPHYPGPGSPVSYGGQQVQYRDHKPVSQTSSAATQELDTLMATLSDFKMKDKAGGGPQRRSPSPGSEPSYAKPQKSRNLSQSSSANTSMQGANTSMQVTSLSQCNGANTSMQVTSLSQSYGTNTSMQVTNYSQSNGANTSMQVTNLSQSYGANTSMQVTNYSQSNGANTSMQSSGPGTGTMSSGSAGGQLESMLGDLQSDLSKQGVNTKSKGLCAACNQPVVGQVITALGKIWHIEHFTCAQCHETLGTKNFYERDGVAYCERDYHSLFAPRCAYCNGPIVDKCVTALNATWHPEHFFCGQCGRPFGDEGFHEKDGKAYCRADFFELFAPKCGGCGRAIVDNYISGLNRHWHPECFACWECHQPFNGGSFFDYEGLPYCENHYHLKRGSLCAGCSKPITGRCITAMYKKFHPEHFVCAFCLKQLNKGTFKEQNDRPYCHPCFVKLFG